MEKSKNTKAIVWVVVGILVVIAIVVSIALSNNNDEENQSASDTDSSSQTTDQAGTTDQDADTASGDETQPADDETADEGTQPAEDEQNPALTDIHTKIAGWKTELENLDADLATAIQAGCGADPASFGATFQDLTLRFATVSSDMQETDLQQVVTDLGDAVTQEDRQAIEAEMGQVGELFISVQTKNEELADLAFSEECGITIEP